MYHSIGVVNKKWHWNYLTCPYEVFESQLKWLKKTGYNTLNFQEIYDYIMNDIPIPKNSIFLNFDDGYLDNYVYAYPLLKKYGMKGTVFVNSDFVDTTEKLRTTIDDINPEKEAGNLDSIGFCNWKELKKMDKEGVLDVQSHAKTHTWYPISDKIVDFRHPKDDYVWMDWNDFPEEKPHLQLIDWNKAKLGKAIFEHEKALSSKRVFINEDFQTELHQFVKKNGNEEFFNQKDWKKQLETVANNLKSECKVVSKHENNDEYLVRIKHELAFTKTEIERNLNKQVNFICWPGGSATKEGMKIATELGYLMSTAARDLTHAERKSIVNTPKQKINRVSRFTPVMLNQWKNNDDDAIMIYSPGWFFVLQLMRFQNKYFAKYWMRYIIYIIIKIKKLYV